MILFECSLGLMGLNYSLSNLPFRGSDREIKIGIFSIVISHSDKSEFEKGPAVFIVAVDH